jgi:hypothetical protein
VNRLPSLMLIEGVWAEIVPSSPFPHYEMHSLLAHFLLESEAKNGTDEHYPREHHDQGDVVFG